MGNRSSKNKILFADLVSEKEEKHYAQQLKKAIISIKYKLTLLQFEYNFHFWGGDNSGCCEFYISYHMRDTFLKDLEKELMSLGFVDIITVKNDDQFYLKVNLPKRECYSLPPYTTSAIS